MADLEPHSIRLSSTEWALCQDQARRRGVTTSQVIRDIIAASEAVAEGRATLPGHTATGRVLHNATRRPSGPIAPPAEQARRWRMLQAGEYQALADRVGFTLEAAAAVARAWGLKPGERRRSDPTLTERERYPTVTTKEGRTYAAPEWPDD